MTPEQRIVLRREMARDVIYLANKLVYTEPSIHSMSDLHCMLSWLKMVRLHHGKFHIARRGKFWYAVPVQLE